MFRFPISTPKESWTHLIFCPLPHFDIILKNVFLKLLLILFLEAKNEKSYYHAAYSTVYDAIDVTHKSTGGIAHLKQNVFPRM